MTVFVKIKENGRFRDVAALITNEPLSIGRAEDADVSVPDDKEMSHHHAAIELQYDHQCLVRDLSSSNGTFLNNRSVDVATVSAADVIRCGSTEFAVEWYAEREVSSEKSGADVQAGKSGSVAAASADSNPVTSAPRFSQPAEPGNHLNQVSGFVEETAAAVIERFALPPDELALQPEEGETPDTFARRLLQSEEPNATLRFLAYALPKRCAVWWLIECIRHVDGAECDADKRMLEAARTWVVEPSAESRRRAMELAEQMETKTPAAWAAVAAFFSDGSMAPPNAVAIPPGDDLTGKVVGGAVILCTVLREPEKAADKRKALTELGLRIAAGEDNWEQARDKSAC